MRKKKLLKETAMNGEKEIIGGNSDEWRKRIYIYRKIKLGFEGGGQLKINEGVRNEWKYIWKKWCYQKVIGGVGR